MKSFASDVTQEETPCACLSTWQRGIYQAAVWQHVFLQQFLVPCLLMLAPASVSLFATTSVLPVKTYVGGRALICITDIEQVQRRQKQDVK